MAKAVPSGADTDARQRALPSTLSIWKNAPLP